MKKIIYLLLILTVILVVGCSSKQENAKTEEELRAEIRAEMEKEKNSEDNIESFNLKTFADVYNGDLNVALDYFNDNIDNFSDNEKVDFSKSLIEVVSKESQEYVNYIYEELQTAYVPMAPTFDSGLYDFYDFETREFNIGYFKDEYKNYYNEFKKINDSKLFTIATVFYVDNGYIELLSFKSTLKSEIYFKLKPALEVVPEGYANIKVELPNKLYKDVDLSSDISSENILVENLSQLKEFEGKDTWKSIAFMPVIFIEKEIPKETPKEISSYGYNKCVVKDIEYIVGGNLTLRTDNLGFDKNYSFSNSLGIFGTITDATLSYAVLGTESSKTLLKSYGTLTNTYLEFVRLDKGCIYWFDFVADGKKQQIALVDAETRNYVKDFAGAALTDIIYFSNASNVPVVVQEPESEKFTAETINGQYINYSDYTTVIVPFYNGINFDEFGELTELNVMVSDNDKNVVSFAVFGTMTNVTITGIENMGDTGISKHYDEITDKLVKVFCRLPNDMSAVTVVGYVHTVGEENKVQFSLDDMRDISDYEIFKY